MTVLKHEKSHCLEYNPRQKETVRSKVICSRNAGGEGGHNSTSYFKLVLKKTKHSPGLKTAVTYYKLRNT